MQAFELTQLISQQADSNKPYLEFLKVPDLSMGLYILLANGTDPQSPHTEDEVYYVASGWAKMKIAMFKLVRSSMWRRMWSTASTRLRKS